MGVWRTNNYTRRNPGRNANTYSQLTGIVQQQTTYVFKYLMSDKPGEVTDNLEPANKCFVGFLTLCFLQFKVGIKIIHGNYIEIVTQTEQKNYI